MTGGQDRIYGVILLMIEVVVISLVFLAFPVIIPTLIPPGSFISSEATLLICKAAAVVQGAIFIPWGLMLTLG